MNLYILSVGGMTQRLHVSTKNMNEYTIQTIKNTNIVEFTIKFNGNKIDGILGIGSHYNWLSFPSLNISCQLATFSDAFWNREQLSNIFDDDRIVNVLCNAIPKLTPVPHDEDFYFDGKSFLNPREYIFFLESHNESLSRQLIETEIKMNSLGFDMEQIKDDFMKDRINDYKVNRKQYGEEL